MFSEIASAKRDAERLRGPGNVFYITQVPAILLRGLKTSIVLADPREDVPFRYFHGLGVDETPSRYGAWLNGIYPGIATRDAVDAFAADSSNWTGRDRDPGDLVSGVLPSAARVESSRVVYDGPE